MAYIVGSTVFVLFGFYLMLHGSGSEVLAAIEYIAEQLQALSEDVRSTKTEIAAIKVELEKAREPQSQTWWTNDDYSPPKKPTPEEEALLEAKRAEAIAILYPAKGRATTHDAV